MRSDWKALLLRIGQDVSPAQTGRVLKYGLALIQGSGRAKLKQVLALNNVRENLRPDVGQAEPRAAIKPLIDILLLQRAALNALAAEQDDDLRHGWRYVRIAALLLAIRQAAQSGEALDEDLVRGLAAEGDLPFLATMLQRLHNPLEQLADKDPRFEPLHGHVSRLIACMAENGGAVDADACAGALAESCEHLPKAPQTSNRSSADIVVRVQSAAALAIVLAAAAPESFDLALAPEAAAK